MQYPPGSRPTRHSADRLTALALVVSIGVAALLGLWLFPRATDWLPSSIGQGIAVSPDPSVRLIPKFATPAAPTLAPAPTSARPAATAAASVAQAAPVSSAAWRGRAQSSAPLVAEPGSVQAVDQLEIGALVLVRDQQNGPDGEPWYRARRPGGREGWVPAGVIVPWTAPTGPQPAPTALPGRTGVPAAAPGAGTPTTSAGAMGSASVVRDPEGKGVQLHAAPDPQSPPGKLLPNGTQVSIVRFAVGPQGNAWAQVLAGDATGWAPVRALAPSTRCRQAAATVANSAACP